MVSMMRNELNSQFLKHIRNQQVLAKQSNGVTGVATTIRELAGHIIQRGGMTDKNLVFEDISPGECSQLVDEQRGCGSRLSCSSWSSVRRRQNRAWTGNRK